MPDIKPMKVIFESETEIGKCEDGLIKETASDRNTSELWTIYAHTEASVSGTKRMLKIEQRCYLRRGDEIPDQSWVKPEVILEPALDSDVDMLAMIQQTHEHFIVRALKQFPEGCLVLA